MTLFGKILVGAILVVGGIFLVKGAHKNKTESPVADVSTQTENATPAPAENSFNGSFNELIARGGNYKCDFLEENEVSTSSGTVYIAGKKIRGDFESTVKAANNMKVESHMLSDGDFIYSWSSMMPTGIKIKLVENTATPSGDAKQGFDYNHKLDYKCLPWMEDSSMFSLPAGIKFTEAPKA